MTTYESIKIKNKSISTEGLIFKIFILNVLVYEYSTCMLLIVSFSCSCHYGVNILTVLELFCIETENDSDIINELQLAFYVFQEAVC